MRKVDRGPWPRDHGTNAKKFDPYTKAKADLICRLGEYCSYCERLGDLHVEHVVPRSHRPDLEQEWTNFLLGCVNCNAIKSNTNRSRNGYLWPDQDDTEAAFSYLPEGMVRVRDDLPGPTRTKAQNLFDLVGLGRRPTNNSRVRDLRWRKRREAWGQANFALRQIKKGADVEWVIRLAKAVGFFSVWMTVFADDPQMCDRLRRSFPGTR